MTGSKFIKPSVDNRIPGKLPKFQSRHYRCFENICYDTDAPPAPAPKPKPDTRTSEQLLVEIQARLDKTLEGIATKEELEAIRAQQAVAMKDVPVEELRALLDIKDGAMAMITRQGLEIQRLSAKLSKVEERGEDMSLRGQVTRWVEKNKEALDPKVARKNRSIPSMELQLRVDSPMHVSTVNPTASNYIGKVQVESGINEIIRVQPIFWDYIKKGRTSAPTYVWVNEYNALGEAAFIGPGDPKPGVSFAIRAEQSVAKKIADSAKAGTELLQDIEGIITFIETELRYKVMIKANQRAMIGDATVDPLDITGIQTLSVPFPNASGIETTNANFMDALRAGVGYMRSGLLTGPITIFINSIDATNMDMAKAVDSGVYLMPSWYTSDGKKVAGATIVEDYNVPVGSVQFAFLDYYRILMYQDFYIEWGWVNDDFTRNLVTAIGEMRLHQFFNTIYTGAFMFDTFENIKTAINVPSAP